MATLREFRSNDSAPMRQRYGGRVGIESTRWLMSAPGACAGASVKRLREDGYIYLGSSSFYGAEAEDAGCVESQEFGTATVEQWRTRRLHQWSTRWSIGARMVLECILGAMSASVTAGSR